MKYESEILYHRTPGGKLKTWQVITDKEDYYTLTGDVGSTPRKSSPTRCYPKNVGRSNERDAVQSAIDTAKSKRQAKLDSGYVLSIEEIEKQDKIPRAMLAKPKFDKELHKVESAAKKGLCLVQPKLDGFRCLADDRGLWTRELRRFDTCRHIEKELEPLFKENPGLVIDGELYNHNLKNDFGKIQSLLTKKDVGLFDQIEAETTIQYHVYDFVSDEPFTSRFISGMKKLSDLKYVKIVKTTRVWDLDSIYKKNALFLEMGYEGTMVRLSVKGYEQNKRASQLIKLKKFEDSEFVIKSVNEGKGQWSGFAKSLTCYTRDGSSTFDAGCSGNQALLKNILENADDYIGGKTTVQYFGVFPSGKPRFPVAVKYFKR